MVHLCVQYGVITCDEIQESFLVGWSEPGQSSQILLDWSCFDETYFTMIGSYVSLTLIVLPLHVSLAT